MNRIYCVFRKGDAGRRAQAATELLLTYGWAALILVAAVAAIAYFGVFNFKELLPEYCEFPAGFDCVDRPAADAAADRVSLAFRNNLGSPINITGVATQAAAGGCRYSSYEIAPGNLVENDAAFTVRVSCSNDLQPGGMLSEEITISYVNTDTGLRHPAVGRIKART